MNQHRPHRASRAELERRIGIIRSNMKTLLRLFPQRDEFRNEFASFAADVTTRASAQDEEWVRDQLKQLLNEHGVASWQTDLSAKPE